MYGHVEASGYLQVAFVIKLLDSIQKECNIRVILDYNQTFSCFYVLL